MASATETVIAELIEARRAAQAKVREIDDALLALQRVTSVAVNLKRHGGSRGPRSVEARRAQSERMRQRWAAVKATEQSPEFAAVS